MFSLRSLLALRPSPRHFVLLDGDGLCRAFHHATQAPQGPGWIEIDEPQLTWLHRPLPDGARLAPVVTHASAEKVLAA